jgi:hypothetical protein
MTKESIAAQNIRISYNAEQVEQVEHLVTRA